MYGIDFEEPVKKPFHILRKFMRKDGKTFEKDELLYLVNIQELKKAAILDFIKFEWIVYDNKRFPYDYELIYSEMNEFSQTQVPEFEFEKVEFFSGPSICDCGSRVVSGVDDNSPLHALMCVIHTRKWKDATP